MDPKTVKMEPIYTVTTLMTTLYKFINTRKAHALINVQMDTRELMPEFVYLITNKKDNNSSITHPSKVLWTTTTSKRPLVGVL